MMFVSDGCEVGSEPRLIGTQSRRPRCRPFCEVSPIHPLQVDTVRLSSQPAFPTPSALPDERCPAPSEQDRGVSQSSSDRVLSCPGRADHQQTPAGAN